MNTGVLPDRFLFMKVGNHAGESWEQILDRKRREFDEAGFIFWGYGGVACHPLTQVQPFARLSVREQGGIVLVMEPINSKADPDVVPAREYSIDGIDWNPIPKGVRVTGSRYAFVLDEIKPGDLEVPLEDYEIGIGPSKGKGAERYLQGRTDKGCLVRRPSGIDGIEPEEKLIRKGGFVAQLKDPFAVLLR